MLKLIALSLLATLACVLAHAQKPDYRYGKVSVDELKMTVYDKDPDANAVYLYEFNDLYYQITSEISRTTDYRARIKILKPEGVNQADIAIHYIDNYNLRDNITGIDAVAYNLVDGKIVKTPLKKQYIFKEEVNEHRKVIKFSIPEVREGTVIEYKYRISSRNITHIPSFRFQHDIPVMRCRMKAAMPEFFRFNRSLKGYVRIPVNQDVSTASIGSGADIFTYNVHNIQIDTEDIPALKSEPYVWYLDDFRSTLDFELSQIAFPFSTIQNYTTTWESVNDALKTSSFNTHCRIGNPFKKEIEGIKAGEGSPLEKIYTVLRVVQSKMEWNGEFRLFSQGPRAAANKGSGSSADINFVLMAALKDAGFKVDPVLLSPRHMGRLSYTHPTIDGINAFVLRVTLEDGNHIYLDGTNPNSTINILPTTLLADRARIYGINGQAGWCDLTNLTKNAVNVNVNLKLNEDGTLTGTFVEQHINQSALRLSSAYTRAKSKEEYIEELEKEHGLQIEDLSIEGIGSNLVVQEYKITMHPTSTTEFAYINSTVVPFMSKNELNAQQRTLPVEFTLPLTYTIRGTIALPEGYAVEELPKNINITVLEDSARSRYISNVTGPFVQFNFQFALKRITYIPSEFPDLNTFYGAVVDLNNSKLVIRKNTAAQ